MAYEPSEKEILAVCKIFGNLLCTELLAVPVHDDDIWPMLNMKSRAFIRMGAVSALIAAAKAREAGE